MSSVSRSQSSGQMAPSRQPSTISTSAGVRPPTTIAQVVFRASGNTRTPLPHSSSGGGNQQPQRPIVVGNGHTQGNVVVTGSSGTGDHPSSSGPVPECQQQQHSMALMHCQCGVCMQCIAADLRANAAPLNYPISAYGTFLREGTMPKEEDDGLVYTVIDILEVPPEVNPKDISVFVDDDDVLMIQAIHHDLGTLSDDLGFEISEDLECAIDQAMSYAKMSRNKEPVFRRAIAELMCTNTSVSQTWRKYKINHITLTKYYRMTSEFLKGELPLLKKGKRSRAESARRIYRQSIRLPDDVDKETVKCYFEPWDGRLTITAALLSPPIQQQEQLQQQVDNQQQQEEQRQYPEDEVGSNDGVGPEVDDGSGGEVVIMAEGGEGRHFDHESGNHYLVPASIPLKE